MPASYIKTYTTSPQESDEHLDHEKGRDESAPFLCMYESPFVYMHPTEMAGFLVKLGEKAILVQQYDIHFKPIIENEPLDPYAPTTQRPGSDFLFLGSLIKFRNWSLLRKQDAMHLEIISETQAGLEDVLEVLNLP